LTLHRFCTISMPLSHFPSHKAEIELTVFWSCE